MDKTIETSESRQPAGIIPGSTADRMFTPEENRREIEKWMKLMEEMAGDPTEHGKRQPGERNKYELSNLGEGTEGEISDGIGRLI